MAKETMIVFVYDTECLKDEADDPVKAVLYFHPSWVSDTQKIALCGQLMGTTYFLKYCFFKPRIISLQNGKFVFKEFGRFILAVGTDRNIADNILQQRADLLASLIRFYHCDLQIIFEQFSTQQEQQQKEENSSLQEQPQQQQQYNKNFSDKLYQIFETYLPILQCNGNVFHYVPKLRLPKTASNIYLDAIQTLQHCQQTKGILAGAILYHNKIVASQLSDEITKQLVVSDPLHIRGVGEYLHTSDFHIPNGVQMLVVYIKVKDYEKLAAESKRAQTLQTMQLQQSAASGAGGLPFQFAKRKMKRDKSLIFSNIPEECGIESNSGSGKDTCSDEAAVDCCADMNNSDAPPLNQMPPQRPKSLLIRPTHLPLRSKNTTRDILPESGIASINFDESDSYPEFIGRTSVCSTPMTENKVLHVDNIMSICANGEDEPKPKNALPIKLNIRRQSINVDYEKYCQHLLTKYNYNKNNNNNKTNRFVGKRSLTDLQDSWNKLSRKFSFKVFATEDENTDLIENGNNNVDNGNDEEESEKTSSISEAHSLTITDPTCPLLDANGQPISRSLFQEFLEKYYKLCAESDNKQRAELAELIKQFKEFESELQQLDGTLPNKIMDNNSNIPPPSATTTKTPMDKKSLTLPLKSIADAMHHLNEPLPATRRQQIGSIPLTPLMAKLSVLALNEERGILATPGSVNADLQTPIFGATKAFPRRNSLKCDEAVDALSTANGNTSLSDTTEGLRRVELYMCGQQNMTLLLLMDEGASLQQSIVQSMFDICVGKFPHMESQLNQTLNMNVEGDQTEGNYSFIAIDNKWDAIQRTGPWNPFELSMLECLNRDLRNNNNNITNIILRSQDAVFYGQKSGRTEFYYKEPANQILGLPPPSDAMGHVVMRAKTRLERDHSYTLF